MKEQIVPRIRNKNHWAGQCTFRCTAVISWRRKPGSHNCYNFSIILITITPEETPLYYGSSGLSQCILPALHQPLFQNHTLQEGYCKKYEIKIRHVVTRLFHVICFLNRNNHYDGSDGTPQCKGIKVNMGNSNLLKMNCL